MKPQIVETGCSICQDEAYAMAFNKDDKSPQVVWCANGHIVVEESKKCTLVYTITQSID
jgi:hypothetical protein